MKIKTVMQNIEMSEQKYVSNENLAKPNYYIRAIIAIQRYGIDIGQIAEEERMIQSSGRMTNLRICTQLYEYKKNWDYVTHLRNAHIEHAVSHMGSEILYTDGSWTEEETGFAVLSGDEIHAQKIQEHATIFTAELHAILEAVQRAKTSRKKHMTIATDSRSSIAAITMNIQ